MREIMTASRESINQILTPEQQTKWKDQVEKMRQQRANGGAGAAGAPATPASPAQTPTDAAK